MNKFRNVSLWLGFGISVLSIFFVFKIAGLEQTAAALGDVDATYAALCVIFTFVHIAVRNRRWQITISHTAGFLNCLWAQGAGFIFTMFLPLRLGDAVRAIALAELERARLWTVATSVVVERVIDVFVTLALLFFLLSFLDVPPEIAYAAVVMGAVAAAVVAAMLLGVHLEKFLSDGRLKALIVPVLEQVRDALAHVTRLHVAGPTAPWTAIGWLVGVFRHWLALAAFVPEATAMESLVLTVMLSLATALGVTIILHLALFFVTTVTGAIGIAIISRRLAQGGTIARFREKAKAFIGSASGERPDA